MNRCQLFGGGIATRHANCDTVTTACHGIHRVCICSPAANGLSDKPFLRLARWVNAPTTGLELINKNILSNHHVRQCNDSLFNAHTICRDNSEVDGS
jgi:hypothetical protein